MCPVVVPTTAIATAKKVITCRVHKAPSRLCRNMRKQIFKQKHRRKNTRTVGLGTNEWTKVSTWPLEHRGQGLPSCLLPGCPLEANSQVELLRHVPPGCRYHCLREVFEQLKLLHGEPEFAPRFRLLEASRSSLHTKHQIYRPCSNRVWGYILILKLRRSPPNGPRRL